MESLYKRGAGLILAFCLAVACSCVTVFADDASSIPAHNCDTDGHAYAATQTVMPSCTEGGYTVYACSVCGATEQRDQTLPAGHKYVSAVTAPTCVAGGYTTHTCSVCGANYRDAETAVSGHQYSVKTVAPTCEEGGFDVHTCTVCGATFKDNYTSMLQHTYKNTVTSPTCSEQGYTTHICTVCGLKSIDSYKDALGHNYNIVVKAATCTEGGYTSHTCSRCGASYVDGQTNPTAHQWDKGCVTKRATERADGVRTYTCALCGTTKTAAIPALGVWNEDGQEPAATSEPEPKSASSLPAEEDVSASASEPPTESEPAVIPEKEINEPEALIPNRAVLAVLAFFAVLGVLGATVVILRAKRKPDEEELSSEYDEGQENDTLSLIGQTVTEAQSERNSFAVELNEGGFEELSFDDEEQDGADVPQDDEELPQEDSPSMENADSAGAEQPAQEETCDEAAVTDVSPGPEVDPIPAEPVQENTQADEAQSALPPDRTSTYRKNYPQTRKGKKRQKRHR